MLTKIEIKYKKIPDLEKKINKYESMGKDGALLSEVVTEEMIAKIISKSTNIPITKIMKGEKEKLLNPEKREEMKKRGGENNGKTKF